MELLEKIEYRLGGERLSIDWMFSNFHVLVCPGTLLDYISQHPLHQNRVIRLNLANGMGEEAM